MGKIAAGTNGSRHRICANDSHIQLMWLKLSSETRSQTVRDERTRCDERRAALDSPARRGRKCESIAIQAIDDDETA